VSDIRVTGNQLHFNGKTYRCAIGKGGFSSNKKEGDGATPLGVFSLRECWYRADRMEAPETALPVKIIYEYDGWCDDPENLLYNKHFRHPRLVRGSQAASSVALDPRMRRDDEVSFSYENLYRDDHAYDLIVPLGYNDDPVVAGKGSAIFMHIAKPGYTPTEGCVALAQADLLEVLKSCDSGTLIDIRKG